MPDLLDFIRDVPGFPREGVVFKDITPLLADAAALKEAVSRIAEHFRNSEVGLVAAVEARGFIFGAAVAVELGAGFVPLRKPGKLPWHTANKTYQLEYGTDAVEIHRDAVAPGARVLMVDDLLATGGTMAAACDLVEDLGGQIVGCAFVIELAFLHGRERLTDYDVLSLITYDSQ
ncbi:MAG: adenine phosphoribosyltransferase [Planctomycetes bacterium DG_20]|nr:MAG: adenine phosphoribosyltransferase [Planctomycetes bacterium DG_20]